MINEVKDLLYAIKNCLENEGASRCYICPYAHLLSGCMTSMLSDSSEYIQQLEEQLATLNEQFESMHQNFRELAARNNAGEDMSACEYCKKNFGECNCNCLKDFEWRCDDGIEQEQNNDE